MFCSKCGTQLAEGVEFCSKCGTPVAVASVPIPIADVYCDKCGYKIGPHNTKCLHCGAARPDATPYIEPVAARKGVSGGQVMLIVAGLVCMVILYRAFFAGSTSSSDYEVTYRVTGSTNTVSLTINNASGNTEQMQSVHVPWERSFPSDGGFAYVAAQNQNDSGTVHCEILVDGRVIETANSSGGYTIASCSGSVP